MALTIRELILRDIQTTLEGIKRSAGYDFDVAQVSRDEILPYKLRYPSIVIVPEFDDTDSEQAYGKTMRSFDVLLRTWVKGFKNPGQTLELFIGDVQKAMMTDLTRSGNAIATREAGIGNVYSEDDEPERGADLLFNIQYRHGLQDATVK